MSKALAALLVVAAAVVAFPAASSASSARAGSACTLTSSYKALLVYLHSPTSPPQEATTVAFGGAKGTECNDGPVSVQTYPNVSRTAANNMHPHEAKSVKGPCRSNYAYTGSNTTVVTNAKTNKSVQKTSTTAVDFCEEGNFVAEIIATLENTEQYQHVESLEEAIMNALAGSATK